MIGNLQEKPHASPAKILRLDEHLRLHGVFIGQCDLGSKPGGYKWPAYQAAPDQSGFGVSVSPVYGALLPSRAIYRLRVHPSYPSHFSRFIKA